MSIIINGSTGITIPPASSAAHASRLDQVSLMPPVASSSSPDIFGAAGTTINYTGSITATSIAACTAAQIGSKKTIIPAVGASFTASVDMIIDGATSGTYLMPANAKVEILATSITTFEITTIFATGSWTPAYALSTPGTSNFGTYSAQSGVYTKIGNRLTAVAVVTAGTFTLGTGSGTLYVTGLPFLSGFGGGGYMTLANSFATLAPTNIRIASNSAVGSFYNASGASYTLITHVNCATGMSMIATFEYAVTP